MTTNAENYLQQLDRICAETIAPQALAVDREGAFPAASIAALRLAGLMGAVSAPEAGGLGLGFGGAATIVRRIAEECGSTAMVLCMHYCGTAVLEAHATREVRQSGGGRRPSEHAGLR